MRPFERDDMEYRKQRAVAAFNAYGPMAREYKRLHPAAESAVCHVAGFVVPRQVCCACDRALCKPSHSHTPSTRPCALSDG
jgi:hypothetical protein